MWQKTTFYEFSTQSTNKGHKTAMVNASPGFAENIFCLFMWKNAFFPVRVRTWKLHQQQSHFMQFSIKCFPSSKTNSLKVFYVWMWFYKCEYVEKMKKEFRTKVFQLFDCCCNSLWGGVRIKTLGIRDEKDYKWKINQIFCKSASNLEKFVLCNENKYHHFFKVALSTNDTSCSIAERQL